MMSGAGPEPGRETHRFSSSFYRGVQRSYSRVRLEYDGARCIYEPVPPGYIAALSNCSVRPGAYDRASIRALTFFTALAAVDFAELSAFSAISRTPLSLLFLPLRLADLLALAAVPRLVEVRLRELPVFLLDFLEPDFVVFAAIVTSG